MNEHGGASEALFYPTPEQRNHEEDLDERHLECEDKHYKAKKTACGTSNSIQHTARQLQQ